VGGSHAVANASHQQIRALTAADPGERSRPQRGVCVRFDHASIIL
jgi:hypothetical protein